MRYECGTCGITPFDLPDEVDAEFIFESDGKGGVYCHGCGLSQVAEDHDE